jgi:hypothetical protein
MEIVAPTNESAGPEQRSFVQAVRDPSNKGIQLDNTNQRYRGQQEQIGQLLGGGLSYPASGRAKGLFVLTSRYAHRS